MLCSVLDEQQIARIRSASLDILEQVGVDVPHPEVVDLLAQHGARIGDDHRRAHLPAPLVTKLTDGAGKTFTIHGRDLARKASFGTGSRNYNSISGEASWLDAPGGTRRYTVLSDVALAARTGDALDALTVVGAMADPHDVPPGSRCVHVLAELLRNTTKPVGFWFYDRASAAFVNEILLAVRGNRGAAIEFPLCYPLLEPISPLRFPFDGLDLLFETSRLRLPVQVGPMAQMGLSAPCTLAGTMALENAEILAGICMTQVICPGLPVCYGGICHAFDMGTTQMIFAGPEQAIFGVAMTQVGKSYGFPVYVNVGLTDSKRPDAQAGLESGTTLLPAAAAGADIFGHLGIAGVDQAASLDMLILQHEAIRYVESALRRPTIDDDTLAVDLVASLGPGGTFIDTVHTAEHFREELWFPEILDRQYYEPWTDGGAPSTEALCGQRKQAILGDHEPEPLSLDLAREIQRIEQAADAELLG